MPLTINVGLSRKASKDYQSTGVSINVTAELDQSLLARPQELQQQIDGLYAQAETALSRQTNPAKPEPTKSGAGGGSGGGAQAGNGRNGSNGRNGHHSGGGNGNGHTSGGGGGQKIASITASQKRAIGSICQRLGLDADAEAGNEFGLDVAEMSIRQASQFIDHLKNLQTASAPGNGGGR